MGVVVDMIMWVWSCGRVCFMSTHFPCSIHSPALPGESHTDCSHGYHCSHNRTRALHEGREHTLTQRHLGIRRADQMLLEMNKTSTPTYNCICRQFICTHIPSTHLLSCSDYPICIFGCLGGKSEFELPIHQVYFQTAGK